jgi:hypothetical protein
MDEPSAIKSGEKSRAARGGGDGFFPRRFAWALALLIFIPFWNVLLGFSTFVVRDFGLFSYPVAFFQRQSFWNGQMPWWNPLSCCGLPFLAQFNTLCLYPPALIYLLLPLSWSLPFFCLLHLFFGGMGMYFLAARWAGSRAGAALAGVVFAFNGLSLNFLVWPSHIATFAWMPWVILLTETGWRQGGRKLVLAAPAAALQILAGGPESIAFTWLILLLVGLLECGRKSVRMRDFASRFFLMGFLALCLAAAQLLPFADFALHGNRSFNYGASDWAMPPWGWANFLVPMFQSSDWLGMAVQPGQYWTQSYYVGIGIMFLAALAVWRRREGRVWLLGGMVALSLVLALGDQGFLYLWLRRLFPFLGFFRYPVKFIIVTSALLPLLAAYAVSHYENWPGRTARGWRPEACCAAAIVMLVGVILWFARHSPVAGSSWPATLRDAGPRLFFLAAFLAAIYYFATRPARRRWSLWLLLVICWADLITAMPWQNPATDASVYDPGFAQMFDKLNPPPSLGQSRLMLSPFAAHRAYYEPMKDVKTTYLMDRAAFLSDCNLLDNFPKVDGFFSLYLRETDRVLRLLGSTAPAEMPHLEDFLGVSQTVAPGKILEWVPRTTYLPVVTAGQQPIFADDQTAFNAIKQGDVNFRQVVYLPREAESQVAAKREPDARVVGKQFSENRESVQIETSQPALVFISQAHYHNWKAEVDGKPVPLWRANYAFQAVEVPAGKHEVTVLYKDEMFRIGTILGLWFSSSKARTAGNL